MTSLLSYKKIFNPQISVCIFLEVSKQPLVWLTKSENQLFIDFFFFKEILVLFMYLYRRLTQITFLFS